MLLPRAPDPFLEQMFTRMSPGAKFTFTPMQIDEIKKAFGARSMTRHALDCRYSISFLGKSYYLVFLAGRERRTTPRYPWTVTKLSRTIAVGAATMACCGLVALIL
jgi:hypothetical protein